MIFLHAGYEAGQLLIWGETRSAAKGRLSSSLPFGAGPKALARAIQSAIDSGVKLKARETWVWLPTAAGRPAASTPLIADPLPSGRASVVKPWLIQAAQLPLNRLLEFLSRCVSKTALSPGVFVGSTLAYWASAMRLAGAMVAQESFLPDVDVEARPPRACWRAVPGGSLGSRLRDLAGRMPSACRALSSNRHFQPKASPLEVLTGFVHTCVDLLVREGMRPAPSGPTPANPHERWLRALQTSPGTLPEQDARELARDIGDWRRPVVAAAEAAFKLCFRLAEPGPEVDVRRIDRPWNLDFLLQSADDPSLMVSTAEALGPGPARSLLRRPGFDAREYTLGGLGRAARIWPLLDAALTQSLPVGNSLTTQEAYDFLGEKAWLLEQAGFGVMLPAWWARGGPRNRIHLSAYVKSPTMKAGVGLSMDQLVAFDWVAAVGDQTLTAAELRQLARLKSPLVKLRGQWVHVSQDEINGVLARLKQKDKTSLRDVVRMAFGQTQGEGDAVFGGVTADGWIADLLRQLEQRAGFQEIDPPNGFQGTLRPYQVRGFSWLEFLRRWGLGACLADDMGLGKTVQTLASIQRSWLENKSKPTLLICPMSVVGNWQREAARFTPDLPVAVHHGLERARGPKFARLAKDHALVVSSYALLHRDFEALSGVAWGGLILDEAQYIKNPETKQAKAAYGLKADWRIALTGTPVENHVGDMWSLMEFLNPGLLGTQSAFRRQYFLPIQTGRDPQAAVRLKKLTGPFILRRLKSDREIISDLPDKIEMKEFCTLTKEQASLYQAVIDDSLKSIAGAESGIARRGRILAVLARLKQVCNHPAHFLADNSALEGRSGKLTRLTEMVQELLDAGDRALIFSQFTEMGELIRRHLEETFGQEALFLHGAVTKPQRDRMVVRFQESGPASPRLFVLSLKAGGTGLNLTAANHVFHFDRWWNPAVENQATDRAFRIGQKRNVQVHKFVTAGTLEERIDAMIEGKKELAEQVVGSGENWLTELSNSQLKDLFALRPEAVE